MTILAGDIGGTKTVLAYFEVREGGLRPGASSSFHSRDHASLGEIVARFTKDSRFPVDQACFGVAGPVREGRCETTNLAWVVDSRDLASHLRLPLHRVALINDLEANAYGIPLLKAEDLASLNEGSPDLAGSNAAVISAGTGLGEAGLVWQGKHQIPIASEGGHASFAPENDEEAELLAFLRREYGHVSVERVLSGTGLHNIYRFLRDTGRGEDPVWLAERMRETDPAAAISEAALEGRSDLCAHALEMFVAVYGSEAGNLALKLLASAGVYVGGGIAPKILVKMKEPAFMRAFTAKGRMGPLLEAIPVRVILNDRTALLGAARCAALRASMI